MKGELILEGKYYKLVKCKDKTYQIWKSKFPDWKLVAGYSGLKGALSHFNHYEIIDKLNYSYLTKLYLLNLSTETNTVLADIFKLLTEEGLHNESPKELKKAFEILKDHFFKHISETKKFISE